MIFNKQYSKEEYFELKAKQILGDITRRLNGKG
jgi:hypothetical protein